MTAQMIPEPTVATDSKQAILDAAEQILALHGYAGLSMRELSRQSGLAKSTLYHYFRDKNEIYISVLERHIAIVGDHISSASYVEGDAATRLRAVILAYFEMISRRGIFTLDALRRMDELDRPQLNSIYNQHKQYIVAPIATIIQDGIDDDQFRPVDPGMTVTSLFGMMNGFLVSKAIFKLGLMEADEVDSDVVEHTIDLFLHGIVHDQQ